MNELMERHLQLVIEANKTTNITRISSWDEGVLLHIEDSLAGLPELEAAPEGSYVDLGSGAGYPGIPLAIETGRKTLLVDSVKKKTDILDSFIDELGLEAVSTYHGRIEDLGREQKGRFAAASARALAQLSVIMELASPLLMENGRLICYKAKLSEEELDHALSLQKKLGLELIDKRDFELGEYRRCIVSFRKVGKSQIKLPRRTGLAQNQPL